jgi:hypothetical protein
MRSRSRAEPFRPTGRSPVGLGLSGSTRRRRTATTVAGLGALLSLAFATQVGAANSPTNRDCALGAGLDPDFVRISNVDVNGGVLTVPKSRKNVPLLASESSIPGDLSHHVSFHIKVTTKGQKDKSRSGSGTGKVTLKAPLTHRHSGRKYTIHWSAVFDSGSHSCPSSSTPQNRTPKPFVITVS